MRNFYQLLAEIEKRPGLFMHNVSITSLSDIILGYKLAIHDLIARDESGKLDQTHYPKDFDDFDNFNNWIYAYYGYEYAPADWHFHILKAVPDEEKAFYKFFELFHRFLNGERPPANPNYSSDSWFDVHVEESLAKREARKQATLESKEEENKKQ